MEKRSPTPGPVIQREEFSELSQCSATRCPHKPIYLCVTQTTRGHREMKYCRHHGFQFAMINGLTLPPRCELDAREMDLTAFTTGALNLLHDRISAELTKRGTSPARSSTGLVTFHFEAEGPADNRPYVARLYLNKKSDEEIWRFFYRFQVDEASEGKIRVSGSYDAYPGTIIERREGGVAAWKRFLVTRDGQEMFVAAKEDVEANVRVLKYLQGKIDALDLTS